MSILDGEGTRLSRVVISIIEEIQQATGLSKNQIASFCRISSRTLYRMCSGRMQNPPFKTFHKLFGIYCLFCCVENHKIFSSVMKLTV